MKNILKVFVYFSVFFTWSYGDNCQIINLKGSVVAALACLSFTETSCARSCQIAKQVCICRDSRLVSFKETSCARSCQIAKQVCICRDSRLVSFAGTIVAPNAKVIVGQVGKNFYGAIYAKSIVVHQDTKVIWVPFLRETVNAVIAGVYN